MTNKQFENGRTIYHLELKDEIKPENRHKYYGSLTAMYNDNKEFFAMPKWKMQRVDFTNPYDTEHYRIIKSKCKSTSQI